MDTTPDGQDEKIASAARWLTTFAQIDRPKPIIPALRTRFDLTASQAISAIREAERYGSAERRN